MGPGPEQLLDLPGPREGGGNRSNRYRTQLFSEPVSSWIHTLELPQQAEMGQETREGLLGWWDVATRGWQEHQLDPGCGRTRGKKEGEGASWTEEAQRLLSGQRPWPQTSLCRQGLWRHFSPKGPPSLTPISLEEPNLSLLGPGL